MTTAATSATNAAPTTQTDVVADCVSSLLPVPIPLSGEAARGVANDKKWLKFHDCELPFARVYSLRALAIASILCVERP
jgi:hypothetical protein